MSDEYKPGVVVEIVEKDPGGNKFYRQGLKAELVEQDTDGDWWAQFRGQGNAKGTFDDGVDGIWCIGRASLHFVRA